MPGQGVGMEGRGQGLSESVLGQGSSGAKGTEVRRSLQAVPGAEGLGGLRLSMPAGKGRGDVLVVRQDMKPGLQAPERGQDPVL